MHCGRCSRDSGSLPAAVQSSERLRGPAGSRRILWRASCELDGDSAEKRGSQWERGDAARHLLLLLPPPQQQQWMSRCFFRRQSEHGAAARSFLPHNRCTYGSDVSNYFWAINTIICVNVLVVICLTIYIFYTFRGKSGTFLTPVRVS